MKFNTETKIQDLTRVLNELKDYSDTMLKIIEYAKKDPDHPIVSFAETNIDAVKNIVTTYFSFENLITQLGLYDHNIQHMKYGKHIDNLNSNESYIKSVSNDFFEKINALLHFINVLNMTTKSFLKSINLDNVDISILSNIDTFDPHHNTHLRYSLTAIANLEQAFEKLDIDYQKFKNMTKR